MNNKLDNKKRMGFTLFFILTGFCAAISVYGDVTGQIITTEGKTLIGDIRWLKASKVYVVTIKGVEIRVAPNMVASKKIKPPAELDSAIRSSNIPVLEKIVADYEMLEHDMPAAEALAKINLKTGNPSKAAEMCAKVVESNPSAIQDPDFFSVYCDSLQAIKQYSKLDKALTEVIEQGSRDVAAVAQIKRGDMLKQQGKLKEALVDGYLRTILLFSRVKEAQPEALYKAVKCFEDLKQVSYADKMRKKLLAEYPNDPYAQKVKSGT